MSISQRVGPLTLNSRGRGSLRLGPELSFRFGKRNSGAGALIMLGILLLIEAIRIALVLLVYVAVFLVWLGRWTWFGAQALVARRRVAVHNHDEG